MATWEDTTNDQQAARVAPNWSLFIGLAVVLVLSAGTLAATRLPVLIQAQTAPTEAARSAHLIPLPQVPEYVVVFGSFATRGQAAAYARRVRSKGYIAGVLASGDTFRVVSRSYASVERALFWTTIFGEIGLDTDTTADLHDLES